MIMCQCRLTDCNTLATLVEDFDSAGGCGLGRGRAQESIRELSVLSAHFCSEPQLVLKKNA